MNQPDKDKAKSRQNKIDSRRPAGINRKEIIALVILLIITLGVYLQVTGHEFLSYDDKDAPVLTTRLPLPFNESIADSLGELLIGSKIFLEKFH